MYVFHIIYYFIMRDNKKYDKIYRTIYKNNNKFLDYTIIILNCIIY